MKASPAGLFKWSCCRMTALPLLQVFVRLQWVRQVVRGRYMNAEMSLAGLGLVVMGGLQDELFNLTIDRVQVGTHSVSYISLSGLILLPMNHA